MRSRTFRRTAGTFLCLFGVLSLSGAPVEPDVRKVDPMLLRSDAGAVRSAQRKVFGAPPSGDLAVPVFIHGTGDDPSLPGKIGSLSGSARRISSTVLTARIRMDAVRYISNWPSVSYIEAGRLVRPLLDLSRPAVKADVVHAGTGLPTGFTGRGALIGVVDTGLDGSHPDFNAGAPPASRVVHTFSFSPGVSALSDTFGHGTHVTGIAAGNGAASAGQFTGMAPQAELLVGRAGVSSFFDTDIINAVADLYAYAAAAAKPAAINLSLGGVIGPHDGTSAFESSLNDLATGPADSRRIMAVAAGNEQDQNEHYRAAIPPFGSSTASLTVEPDASSGTASVDLWADSEDRFTVTVAYSGESLSAASGTVGTIPSGSIAIHNRTDAPPNGATHILVLISRPPSGGSVPASIRLDRVRNGGAGTVDGYIDSADGTFSGGSISLSGTIIEPANGENVLAVGSFQTKTFGGGAGSLGISSFSSRGPTRDGRPKPDVAAPGQFIYSSRSSDSFLSPIPGNTSYTSMQGTSMATPHVAGIAALVWESNPALNGAQMRERLRRTADPVGAAPNTTWGFGRVNALRAVRESVASITAPSTAVPGVPVPLSSTNSSSAFTGNPLAYAWSLTARPAGSGATLSANTSSASFTPDVPGNYTVRLEVSQGSPASTPHGVATAVLHANHVPSADFIVPASQDAGQAVTFRGVASDADSQIPAYRWLLVSRPSGSAAAITAADVDNAVFLPDVQGTYEIGLRADDGLDNSALVVHSYTTGASVSVGGGGGGGSCAMVTGVRTSSTWDALGVLLPYLFPGVVLASRRSYRKYCRAGTSRHSAC
ncbi:MAG: hypothetical protein C4529_05385 [Deltaproteobacteria bacterium]|nr:MAG: hypothetical protein C4529_05385 [Deltaproteobacteria bacterium]